jgi:hypothetical protein
MNERRKYIVHIQCQRCGEQYVLKGRWKKGMVETGFKRCVCDNQNDFTISQEEQV